MSAEAWRVLTAVLDNAEPGADWCVDDWRDEADLAELRPMERKEAQQAAVRAGYLRILEAERPGGKCLYMRSSTAPKAKSRAVQIYERTAKRVSSLPSELEGRADLFDLMGA